MMEVENKMTEEKKTNAASASKAEALDIEKIREDINEIDTQIADLFNSRMHKSLEIAEYKKANKLPIFNNTREKAILHRISERVGEPFDGYARVVFNTIFDVSKSAQHGCLDGSRQLSGKIQKALEDTPSLFPKKAIVACQGIAGSYSQAACEKLFEAPSIMCFDNFEGVFNAVEKGLCQYGILPIENSSYGSVTAVYDLMQNYNFHIARSLRLRIHHILMAKPGTQLSDIKEIVSHEQAIGQCGDFIKSLKNVKITICKNTAIAAKMVSESGRNDIAAISSQECLDLYGLIPLKDNIQISDNNYTRFICISKNMEIYPGSNKISLILSVPHVPYALYHTIAKFATLGINLTKLESRPIPGSDFEFMFYFDMDASVYSEEVLHVLDDLADSKETFVFLGCYNEQL